MSESIRRSLKTAKRWLSDAKYGLLYRFHPRYKFHLVNTGLGYGYHDCDNRMLHACMALLCEHVELEHGGAEKLCKFSDDLRANPDPNAPEDMQTGQAERQDEAVTIYRWWKQTRPADKARRHELLMKFYGPERCKDEPLYREFRGLEQKMDDDDEKMLLRLMAIRRSLWT